MVWARDFLPVFDLFFRQIYAFFIIELASRRVVHLGVTSHPTDAWMARQLREATPYGLTPRFLIRGRDSKYGDDFARVAKASSIEVLRTPDRAAKANAVCERFLGSVRRECLDHLLIPGMGTFIARSRNTSNTSTVHGRTKGLDRGFLRGPCPRQPGRGEVGSSRFRSSMDCPTTTGALRESAAVRITSDGVFG